MLNSWSHLICSVDEQIVGDLDQVGEGEGQLVLSLQHFPVDMTMAPRDHYFCFWRHHMSVGH